MNTKSEMNNEITFNIIAENWLKERKNTLSKHSFYVYKSEVDKYILPYLGKLNISEMEKYNYNEFIDTHYKKINIKFSRDIVTKLKSILYYAEDYYDLNFKTRKISLPKLNKRSRTNEK